MAIKITSVAEAVEDNGLKILVHGLAGAGKTVLCATTGANTIILSAEAGLLSIRNAPKNIKVMKIESIEDLDEAYEFFKDSHVCDWIALDSITEIAEQILANEKKENKDPRAAYGMLTERMMEKMRQFRDLPKYNVIMTSKQSRQEDDGMVSFVPMMPGRQVGPQIPYLFDEVFALRVEQDEDGNDYRVLQTSRDAKYEAKDRSGALEMFEKPNLRKILEKIRAAGVDDDDDESGHEPEPEPEKIESRDPDLDREESTEEVDKAEEKVLDKVAEKVAEKADDDIVHLCCQCDHPHAQTDEPEECEAEDCDGDEFYIKED